MKEYRIMYTIDGKGFTKDDAWIDCEADTLPEAIEALAHLDEYNATKLPGHEHETWIEKREVTPWKRLDIKD